jgi:8-hydroxy-5-deazaflavin:NADPH oxidoreductase
MIISRRSALVALGTLSALPIPLFTRAQALPSMRIGVIGAGSLGGTVGRLWVKAGHDVMFSSRHPEELESMARQLGARASIGLPSAAAEFGIVLLFAVPYDALPQLGRDLSQSIKGKIVLDACNPPLSGGTSDLDQEATANGVARTTAKYLPGARVVRAFSCVDATVIELSGSRQGARVGVPIASDDQDAMQVGAGLVVDAGCDPVIVGNLASAVSFQQGGPGWRLHLPAAELRRTLGLVPGN